MTYVSHRPAAPLASVVENVWWVSDAPAHARERVVPSGTVELVVNLTTDEFRVHGAAGEASRRFRGAMISGAYRGPFDIETRDHASILGVHFRPGGSRSFLGVPALALADLHVDLETLWGPAAHDLRERLCGAEGPAARFAIVEDALLARFAHARDAPPAFVGAAVERLDASHARVDAVAAALGYGHRRFIQLFSEEVGMTPKRFARVRRFERALARAERSDGAEWGRIAVASGYFDQSHLIRDFLEFTGFSPKALRRRRGERVKEHHVALTGGAENSSNSRPSART